MTGLEIKSCINCYYKHIQDDKEPCKECFEKGCATGEFFPLWHEERCNTCSNKPDCRVAYGETGCLIAVQLDMEDDQDGTLLSSRSETQTDD